MKILYIPCHSGGYSHIIPSLILDRMLDKAEHESVFLLTRHAKDRYSAFYNRYNIKVLHIDYDGSVSAEKLAYETFKPDVIVDDFSFSTGFLCKTYSIPRVSIQRTGAFSGTLPKNECHRHSSGVDLTKFPDLTKFGFKQPVYLGDLFESEIKIIPGIASLEVLPDYLKTDPSYFYSGPLINEDFYIPDGLEGFFQYNFECKKIYLTYGASQTPPVEIQECMDYILEMGHALITNVESEKLSNMYPDTFYFSGFLPMNYVCSKSDLVIHHCGTGAYYYPIINMVPALIIGTYCYDRDEIIEVFENMSVSEFVRAPEESVDFFQEFKRKFEKMINEDEASKCVRMDKTAILKQEVLDAASGFDFEKALTMAISQCAINSPA